MAQPYIKKNNAVTWEKIDLVTKKLLKYIYFLIDFIFKIVILNYLVFILDSIFSEIFDELDFTFLLHLQEGIIVPGINPYKKSQIIWLLTWFGRLCVFQTGLSGNLIVLAVLYKGGLLAGAAQMTVGELSSFLMYAFWVGMSIGGMWHFWRTKCQTLQKEKPKVAFCFLNLWSFRFWGILLPFTTLHYTLSCLTKKPSLFEMMENPL